MPRWRRGALGHACAQGGSLGSTLARLATLGFDPGATVTIDRPCATAAAAESDDQAGSSSADSDAGSSWFELGVEVSYTSGEVAGGRDLEVSYTAGDASSTVIIPWEIWLCRAACPDDVFRYQPPVHGAGRPYYGLGTRWWVVARKVAASAEHASWAKGRAYPPASRFCVSASRFLASALARIPSPIEAIGSGCLSRFRRGPSSRATRRASMRAAIVASYPWSPGT